MPKGFTEAEKYINGYLTDLEKATERVPAEAVETYRTYLQSLKQLAQCTHAWYTSDAEGNYPVMSAGARRELLTYYRDVLKNGSLCLQRMSSREPMLSEAAHQITVLNSLFLRDVNALNAVPESQMISLPEAVTLSRGLNFQLPDDNDRNVVSGVSSSRIPVRFFDAAEVERSGFFTEKREMRSVLSELEKRGRAIKALCPALRQEIDTYIHSDEPEDLIQNIRMDVKFAEGTKQKLQIMLPEGMTLSDAQYRAMAGPELDAAIGDFFDYAVEAGKIHTQYTIGLGLEAGQIRRIDSRNSAMSAVATLLDVPDLLAAAVPATLTQNGVTVQGTFMETAQGVDLRTLKAGDPAARYVAAKDPEKAWLKDYFDLQILDYICQNVDRHESNVFYQFDFTDPEAPKLMGLKGIDNDLAFGKLDPENEADFYSGLKNIGFISKSMAETIRALDGTLLRAALEGHGLMEDEISAACDRLTRLQVKLPSMTVVEDGHWTDYTMKQLKPDINSKSGGVFKKIYQMDMVKRTSDPNTEPTEPVQFTRAELRDPLGSDQFRKTLDKVESLDRLSYEHQHWYLWNAKPQYKEMRRAISKVRRTMTSIGGDPTPDKLVELAADMEDLRTWSAGYLRVKGEPKGTLAENRVNAAQKIQEYTENILPAIYSRVANHQLEITKTIKTEAAAAERTLMNHLTKTQRAGDVQLKEAVGALIGNALLRHEKAKLAGSGKKMPGSVEMAMMRSGTKAVADSLLRSSAMQPLMNRLFPSGRADNTQLIEFMMKDDIGKAGYDRTAEAILAGKPDGGSVVKGPNNLYTQALSREGMLPG